jgi:hypothetical protein
MFCTNCGNNLDGKTKFCTKCGQENKKLNWFAKHKKGLLITGGIIILLIIVGNIDSENSSNSTYQPTQNYADATPNKDKIASIVVNILCTDGTDNGSGGGSGTIMESSGLILTNAHIIPHYETENISDVGCIITLPDIQGKVKEIYYGQPIMIPDLSIEYDLAFVNITEAYTDDDGVVWATYPKTFDSLIDTICENDDVKLGEPVRVFGYPAISGGGYYLTVTDGIVSSLPDDGTIVTSAKIAHGNSGGIATDQNGCFIGVPSMFQGDDAESLGILISNNIVVEFMNKAQTYLNTP